MTKDELNVEECKATWRAEARERAAHEAKEAGLQGQEALAFIADREPEIYSELERLGYENIR